MNELPKKRLTNKQWQRLISRIILVHDPLPYLDQVRASASTLVKSKLSLIPEGLPFPTETPFIETDFTMEAHWIWTGAIIPEQKGRRLKRDGSYLQYPSTFYQAPYSVVSIDGVRTSAHRAFYEHFVEALEVDYHKGSGRRMTPGKLVHDCCVPLCVNPRHWHHQVAPHKRREEVLIAPAPEPVSTEVPQGEVEELVESMLALHQPKSFADVMAHEYFKYGDIPENQIKTALQAVGKQHLTQ